MHTASMKFWASPKSSRGAFRYAAGHAALIVELTKLRRVSSTVPVEPLLFQVTVIPLPRETVKPVALVNRMEKRFARGRSTGKYPHGRAGALA